MSDEPWILNDRAHSGLGQARVPQVGRAPAPCPRCQTPPPPHRSQRTCDVCARTYCAACITYTTRAPGLLRAVAWVCLDCQRVMAPYVCAWQDAFATYQAAQTAAWAAYEAACAQILVQWRQARGGR